MQCHRASKWQVTQGEAVAKSLKFQLHALTTGSFE